MGGYLSESQRTLALYQHRQRNLAAPCSCRIQQTQQPGCTIVADMKNNHAIVDVDDQYFYIQTDLDAPTGKLVAVPIADRNPPTGKRSSRQSLEVLNGFGRRRNLYCTYMKDAVNKVYEFDHSGKQIREVELPDWERLAVSRVRKEKAFYFVFTSYTNPPPSTNSISPPANLLSIKSQKLNSNHPTSNPKQVYSIMSKDGTKIPMIITYKRWA